MAKRIHLSGEEEEHEHTRRSSRDDNICEVDILARASLIASKKQRMSTTSRMLQSQSLEKAVEAGIWAVIQQLKDRWRCRSSDCGN